MFVLRFGLAAVYLWFGWQQVTDASRWITFIPEWLSIPWLPVEKFVLINGLFEIVAAILLILNIFTRIVAFVLAVHMAGIVFSLGISATGVRDFGIGIATLALAFFGSGKE